jgi:oxygen-independent coproporphyrinogen-3 oxidase
MVKALAMEAAAEKNYLQDEKVNTIYFGGGTPSLLSVNDLKDLLSALRKNFVVANDAEITLEANPDDINENLLRTWKELGINRLSIGVQSFFEEELRWMNRAHDARQAIENLELARKYFPNLTMDLIYGSPLLTDEMWKANVDRAIELDIPHLSCYALTVEEKTPLNKLISHHKSSDVDADQQARQFLLLMQWLREKGYEHYEVSNFAKPGFRSRHNSSYWKGEKYLGLGPSAHSYNGEERRWNIANNSLYIKAIMNGETARESEILTLQQRLNEFIMIALRTQEGLDLAVVRNKWGEKESSRIEKSLKDLVTGGQVIMNKGFVQLTDEGMLMADGIASGIFSV